MYLTARKATLVGALAITLIVIPMSASAYGSPGDFVNCHQNPTAPECVLDPETPIVPANAAHGGGSSAECHDGQGEVIPCHLPGKGWYGGDGCWYQPATGNDLAAAQALGGEAVPPQRWYIGACGDSLTNFWPPGYVKFRLFTGQGPGVEVLADRAVKRLRLPAPVIRVNPEPPTAQVVYVPSWLWVDSASWGTRSATASAGRLSVTATAKPNKVVWNTGDGSSVTCDGPGTPWKSGTDPAKASPTCGHTYTTPSSGTYPVRATVTWEISWSGGGQSGTRPALTTTAEVGLRVVEAGGLNTNGVI